MNWVAWITLSILFILFMCIMFFAYKMIQYDIYEKHIKIGIIIKDLNKCEIYRVEYRVWDAIVLVEVSVNENTGEFFETPTSERITTNIREMFINKDSFIVYG